MGRHSLIQLWLIVTIKITMAPAHVWAEALNIVSYQPSVSSALLLSQPRLKDNSITRTSIWTLMEVSTLRHEREYHVLTLRRKTTSYGWSSVTVEEPRVGSTAKQRGSPLRSQEALWFLKGLFYVTGLIAILVGISPSRPPPRLRGSCIAEDWRR